MFITPAHYSDVVDERAIIKLCGYPLCQKKLGAVSSLLLSVFISLYKTCCRTNGKESLRSWTNDLDWPKVLTVDDLILCDIKFVFLT